MEAYFQVYQRYGCFLGKSRQYVDVQAEQLLLIKDAYQIEEILISLQRTENVMVMLDFVLSRQTVGKIGIDFLKGTYFENFIFWCVLSLE